MISAQQMDYTAPRLKKSSNFWESLNKYGLSVVLALTSTLMYDVIGLTFFLLFFMHALAYFLFRIHDEPIDIILRKRNNKIDMRSAFSIIFILLSSICFAVTFTGRLCYALYKKETTRMLVDLQMLDIFKSTFQSDTSVLLTFSMVIVAVLYSKSLGSEMQEARRKDEVALSTIQPIETIGRMSRHHVQHSVLLIKDYKYRGKICINIETLLLLLVASVAFHVLNLPYAALFVVQGSIACLGSSQTARKFSNGMNKLLIFWLIGDLFSTFLVKSGRIVTPQERTKIGFLSTSSTYLSFYLKLLLFLLECQKHQFSYNFTPLYQQLQGHFGEKPELRLFFLKKASLSSRMFQPFSHFGFCTLSLVFAILHPSLVFFLLLPLLLAGPFTNVKSLKRTSQGFTAFVGFYSLMVMIYKVAAQFFDFNGKSTFEVATKLQAVKDIETKVFPGFADFTMFILMALFTKYMGKDQEAGFEDQQPTVDEDLMSSKDSQMGDEDQENKSNKSTVFAPDDTLRGKMRRSGYKAYVAMNLFFEYATDLLIVHCGKLALLTLFLVSIIKPNLLNLGFFILFMVFAVSSHEKVKKYWIIPILFTCTALTLIYATDVFLIEVEDEQNLELVGIGPKGKPYKYAPYLLLLGVLAIARHVFNADRYQEFLQCYALLEVKDFQDGQDEVPMLADNLKQTLGLADPLTKLITKSAIFWLVAAIFVECAFVPISLLNFVLLVFMALIVITYLAANSQLEMYQHLQSTLSILKVYSAFLLIAKYAFQFDIYVGDNLRKNHDSLPLLYKLFGVENSTVGLKLSCLALILVLSNIQSQFLNYRYKVDMLKEEQQDWDRAMFIEPKNRTQKKIIWHNFAVYSMYLTYTILPITQLSLLGLYSFLYRSVLGALFLTSTLLLLYTQQKEFWRKSYKFIGILMMLSMLVIYALQFAFFDPRVEKDLLSWFGVRKSTKTPIYGQVLPLFLLLALCGIQKASLKVEQLIAGTEETYQRLRSSYEPARQRSDGENSALLGEELKEESKEQDLSEDKKQSDDDKDITKGLQIYRQPIDVCLSMQSNMKTFLYQNNLLLWYMITLLCIFWRMNLASIVYAIYLVRINVISYHPKLFSETPIEYEKRTRVASQLRWLILVATALIFAQYALLLGAPHKQGEDQGWKVAFVSNLCFGSEEDFKGCMEDWEQWLSLGYFNAPDLLIDCLMLSQIYLCLFFMDGSIKVDEKNIQTTEPVIGDANDFISGGDSIISSFYFQGMPYVLVFYMMFVAATFHGAGIADAVSTIYLSFSFYYILNWRKLYTKNRSKLIYLRRFNRVVIFFILMFQIPLLPCPLGQGYVTRNECTELMKKHNFSRKDTPSDPWKAFYMVFCESLGLAKVDDVEFSFVLLFLLTELVDGVFSHPYFKVYVIKHMKEDKETDGKLRAFVFVEQCHLRTLWAYKAIRAEIEVLHRRLMRINFQLRNFEYSKHLHDDDLSSDDDNLLPQEFVQEGDEAQMMENIALEQLKPGQPVVRFKKIKAAYEQEILNRQEGPDQAVRSSLEEEKEPARALLEDKEKTREELKEQADLTNDKLRMLVGELKRREHLQNRTDLYHKQRIGLHMAVQSGAFASLEKDGASAFYSSLVDREKASFTEIRGEGQIETDGSFDAIVAVDNGIDVKSQPSPNFSGRWNAQMREFLWKRLADPLLLLTASGRSQGRISMSKLINLCFLSQSNNICYFTFFLNFALSPSLLSLVLPLSALFYALLDAPVPSTRYWKTLMVYTLTVVAIKFLYQLPLFCGTPSFTLYSMSKGCPATESAANAEQLLVNRIDYIIGIKKFAGPSSFPKDQGIFWGVFGDLLVLLALLIHKSYLVQVGLWHYVESKNNIYESPAFKCDSQYLSDTERREIIDRQNFRTMEMQNSSFTGYMKFRYAESKENVKAFFYKLIPCYMPKEMKNMDLRTDKSNYQSQITHKHQKAKPGKDLFSQSFFWLLVILTYSLLCFKAITGEDASGVSYSSLQRFSTWQAVSLFFILAIMMVERMLYRSNQMANSETNQGQQAEPSYLAKHQVSIKLGLHVAMVLMIHFVLGFMIPISSAQPMFFNSSLVIMYFFCMAYLCTSAVQIKEGYPQAPYKQPFDKDTSWQYILFFRVYKAIPFLWEMKVIIDWTVTATSLDLFQWFKLDDAFNYLYQNKIQYKHRAQHRRGAQRPWYEKFFQGFCFAFLLILVILAPILLFSGINPIMVKNPVLSAELQLSLDSLDNGNSYTVLVTNAAELTPLSKKDSGLLETYFTPVNTKFQKQEMQTVAFNTYSDFQWLVSKPALEALLQDFEADKGENFQITAEWIFTRDNPIGNEQAKGRNSVRVTKEKLKPVFDAIKNKSKEGMTESKTIQVENLFPKLLELGSTSETRRLNVQQNSSLDQMTSVNLKLNVDGDNLYWAFDIEESDLVGIYDGKTKKGGDSQAEVEYQSLEKKGGERAQTRKEDEAGQEAEGELNETKEARNLVMVVMNDEVIGSLFGNALNLSVVGLYATIVIAIGRFLRLIFDRISQRVIYEEMPNTDHLFEICEGIFIAQLEGDLNKERKLYDLLIRLYRSPETLLRITGHKLKRN